jgi:hypothetical protein
LARPERGTLRRATPAGRLLRGHGLLLHLGRSRLRRSFPFEARLERRDQIGRRRPCLDLHLLDLLTGDLLLDCLQETLPVLVLVGLGVELGPGELADQPLGERPLLVADLRSGTLVDLGRAVDLVGEVEPLEKKTTLVDPDPDRGRLAAPGE